MKVFVATNEMQGTREGDVFTTEEGELVSYSTGTCGPGIPDAHCPCRRAMDGFDGGLTTTFKVVDMPITTEEYFARYYKLGSVNPDLTEEDIADMGDIAFEAAEDQLRAADHFPENVVLERRDRDIQPRSPFNYTFPIED